MAINPYTGKPYKSKKNIPKDRQEEIDEYQFNRARTKELDQIKNQLFNGPNNMFNQQQNKITTSFNAPDLSGMSINDLTSKVKTDLHDQYIKNIVPDESNKYIKRTNWRNDGFSPDVDINRLKQLQQIKPPDNPYQDPRRVSDYDIDNTKNYIKNTYKPPISSGLMPDTPQYTNTMPNNLNKPNPEYEKFLRERLEARDVEGREGLINITDNPLMKNLYSGILDPLAYEAEKLYKDSWIGRTATQAGQVAGYKMINQDKTPVEKSDQGLIGNISADMVGTILGLMTVKDGGGQSLLNATDDFGRMIGEKVAQKLPTATTKAGAWVNRLAPEVARGAADNAIGDAMVAIGQGKDLKTTAKDTAESAFYGGLFGGITKGADEFIKQRRMDKVINDPNFLYNHNQIGDGTVKPGEAAKGPGTKGPDPEQLSIKGAKDKAKFNPLNDPLKLSKANRMKDRRRMIGGNDVAEDIVTSPGDFDTKYPTVKGHVTPIDDTTVDNEYFEMIPSYRIKRTPKTHEVAQDVQKAPERTNTIPDEDKLLEEQIKTNKSNKVNLERFGECEIIDEDNGQITLKNKKGTEFKIGEAAFEKLKIYDKPAAAPKAADPPQIKPERQKGIDRLETARDKQEAAGFREKHPEIINELDNKIEGLKNGADYEVKDKTEDLKTSIVYTGGQIPEINQNTKGKLIGTEGITWDEAKKSADNVKVKTETKDKKIETSQVKAEPVKQENKTQDEYAKEIKDYCNKINRKDISRKVGVVLELINNGELSNDYLTKVMDDANGKIENVSISKPATKASKQDKIVIKDLTKRLQRADELYRNLGNAGYFGKDKNATLIEKEAQIAKALQKQHEKHEAEKAEKDKKKQDLYDKTYKEYEDKIKADIENGMEFGKLVDKYADDEIEGLDVEGSHFVITIGNKLYEAKEAKEKGLTVEEYRKQYEEKQAKESKETEEFLKNQAYESAIKHTKHSQATIDNALERISEGKKLLKETLEELEINRNGLNYQIKEGGAKYIISGTDKETDLKKFINEEIAKMKELAEKSNDILENHADMVNKAKASKKKASKKKTDPPPIKKESPVKETPKEPDPEYLYKDLNLTNEDMDQINDYKGFDPDTDDADFPEYYLHDTEPESTEIWSKYQAKKKFEPPAITKKGNTKPNEAQEKYIDNFIKRIYSDDIGQNLKTTIENAEIFFNKENGTMHVIGEVKSKSDPKEIKYMYGLIGPDGKGVEGSANTSKEKPTVKGEKIDLTPYKEKYEPKKPNIEQENAINEMLARLKNKGHIVTNIAYSPTLKRAKISWKGKNSNVGSHNTTIFEDGTHQSSLFDRTTTEKWIDLDINNYKTDVEPKKMIKADIEKAIDQGEKVPKEDLEALKKELEADINKWKWETPRGAKVPDPTNMMNDSALLNKVDKALGNKKEFYEMTKDQVTQRYRMPETKHKEYIEKALAEGKSVPENVLKDYPELIKDTATPTQGSEGLKNWLDNVKEDDLDFKMLERSHSGVSFDPDKRAAEDQRSYVRHLKSVYEELEPLAKSDAQKEILLSELQRYKEKYISMTNAIAGAGSRVMSTMITGAANFPVKANEKKFETYRNRVNERTEFSEKAVEGIKKKLKGAMTDQEVKSEYFKKLEKETLSSLATIHDIATGKTPGYSKSAFTTNLANRLKTAADNGHIEEFNKMLEVITQFQDKYKVTVFAKNNAIWSYAPKAAERIEAAPTGQKPHLKYKGAHTIENYDQDRLQIYFEKEGRPPENILKELHAHGWKYSKANNNAWQRKLTNSARYDAKNLLNKFFEPEEAAPVKAAEPEVKAPEPVIGDEIEYSNLTNGLNEDGVISKVNEDGTLEVKTELPIGDVTTTVKQSENGGYTEVKAADPESIEQSNVIDGAAEMKNFISSIKQGLNGNERTEYLDKLEKSILSDLETIYNIDKGIIDFVNKNSVTTQLANTLKKAEQYGHTKELKYALEIVKEFQDKYDITVIKNNNKLWENTKVASKIKPPAIKKKISKEPEPEVKAADPEVKAPEEVPEIKIDTEVKAEQKLAEVVNKDYKRLVTNQAKASKDIESHFPDPTKVKSLKEDIKKLDKEITKLQKSQIKKKSIDIENKINELKEQKTNLKAELDVLNLKFNDRQRELAYNILNAEYISDFEIPTGNKFGMSPMMKFDFVDFSLRAYNRAAETDEFIKFSVPHDGDFEVPNDIGALTLLYDRLGITVKSKAQKLGIKIGDISTKFYENREVSSKWTNTECELDLGFKKQKVTGKANGGLMINVTPDSTPKNKKFAVTHIKTGISLVGKFNTEAQAKSFANEVLKRFDWNGDIDTVKSIFVENKDLFLELKDLIISDTKEYSEKLIELDKKLKERQPEFKINLSLNAGRGINDRMRGVEYRGYERKSVKQARATVAPPPIKKVHQATFEEEIKRNPPKAVKVEPKDRFTAAKPDTSKVKPKIKTSKVKTNTWKNSEFMSDQWVQDVVTDVNADYLEKPNQESFAKAVSMLSKDYDGTVAKLMNITKTSRSTLKGKIPARAKMKNIFAEDQPDIIPMTAEDVAASMIITRDLINSGNSEKLADFLGNFRPNVTNAGQVIQAMSMYKKLTPEGTLMRAAADVDKYFNDVVKDQPHKINDANKTASDIADKMKAVNTEVVDDVIKGVTDKLDDLITDPTGEVDTVIVTSPPPKPAAPETQAQPEPTKGPEELTPEQKQKVKDRLKPPPVGKKKPKTPKEPKTPKAAAGGPVVPPEEIPLEEKLAKRIKSYALSKPKRIEHDDKLLKSLFNVAKDEIDPMYMKQFTSPEEFVRHAIKFREQYNEIWVKAKEIISEEYKDNEEIGALFEDYFNKKLVPVFYEKDLNKAIKLKMKEKGLNLNQLVKQHYIYNKGAENYLVNTLTYGYDFTEEQANYLERYIRTEFKRLTAEKKEKILNDMFKEKGPIKRQETGPIKRIMELSNLGVYNNEKYAKMVYDKKGLPVLTPDDVLFINNKMLQYMTEKDPEMKEIWMGQIARRIGNKQASTTRSKALGLLRISLLGNAKTLLTKNAGGNIGLAIGENFKDYPATVIDYMISKRFDTLRTTAAPGLKTYKEQIFNLYDGLRRVIKDVKFDSDTNPARGRYEIPQGYSFQGKGPVNKVLGTLEKGVNIGLTAGDRPFYQAGRAAQLEQLKRLHGEELPDHMNDLAHDIGKERTYQNESTLNQSMKFIKTGMNKVLQFSPIRPGDIALTYTQTLSNIVDKKLDYTGIGGIIRGAAEFSSFARDIKNNTVMDEAEIMKRQKSIVDRFGRGIVGAAVFGAGIVGGLYGIVTGGEDKRDKIRDLEKSQGMQGNSVKIGKSYHSIDWIESIGTPLLLGADVAQKDKRGYSDYDLIVNAGENIISNDLFTGIKRLMGQYSDGLVDGMIKSVIELPSMFIPTTVKQIAQIVDGTSRDTKGENILETTLNKILNKIPYASKTLPPRVDIWGNDVKLYDGENNPLNVMLNPSYVSKEKENKAAMLTMAVFNERGNTDILPKYAPTTRTVTDIVKNKHQLVLTAEERIEWQRIIGQGVSKEFADLYDSSTFKILDQDKKEERMTEIITKWDNKALEKLCESRRIVLKPKK